MVYIVSQDYGGTRGNHAGMVYLFNKIHSMYPTKTRLFVTSVMTPRESKLHVIFRAFLVLLYSIIILIRLKRDDTVFLTEYLSHGPFQEIMASIIRKVHPNSKIIAIVHLLPESLMHGYTDDELRKYAAKVDKIITLGSSLTDFLNSKNIHNVVTSFHYVDSYYIRRDAIPNDKSARLNVIAMGFNGRKFEKLIPIIKSLPDINFIICNGKYKVEEMFNDLQNVRLTGYLREDDLRREMNKADVSLNVMEDTVGSNVICTSLGMGLAIIVSDVGSIHDYCDNRNAIFCRTEQEFIQALIQINSNREKLYQMRISSFDRSADLSIRSFINDIKPVISFE